MECKSIKDNATILNFKRVTVKVPTNEVKKGGFFSWDYSLFDIETEIHKSKKKIEKIRVQRKDQDFYTLRIQLRKAFPYILVPPLPIKNGKLVEKILIKRQKQFARFLQAVVRSEVLKSSSFLVDFLKTSD